MSNQICNIRDNKYLKFPKTKLRLNIGKLAKIEGKLQQVRIVPKNNHYIVELVFNMPENDIPIKEEIKRVIGIDLGVDNFATISNNIGLKPIIIKGKVLKSINHYYNKSRAHYFSILRQGKEPNEGKFSSNRLVRLDNKRNDKVNDFVHKSSRAVIDFCIKNDIDTIIIGNNKAWKQNINIGKVNNQNFVYIPFASFIDKLKYKAEDNSIKVIVTEESYTSKVSFLDYDSIPSYEDKENTVNKPIFSGKRIERGIYKIKNGNLVNADINAAYNIILKVIPEAFKLRDIGFVNSPLVLNVA